MSIKGEIYRNDKTKMVYKVVEEVVNATNAQDGQKMVLYTRHGEYFVRETKEFHEKFTRVLSEEEEGVFDPFTNSYRKTSTGDKPRRAIIPSSTSA